MKALTLTEPWASLVAIGAKRIETRCWKTSYRGQLAIHSAKGFPRYAKEMLYEPHVYNSWAQFGLKQKFPGRAGCGFPHGCVIAITTLLDCVPTEAIADHTRWGEMVNAREAFLGDYTPGRFAWILGTPMEIEPTPAKGALSLWQWHATETAPASAVPNGVDPENDKPTANHTPVEANKEGEPN